ncbi:MAG: SIS domain-containing protein [Nitrososphaerales archaeon]
MNTLEAFEQDITYQVTDLKKLLDSLNIKKIDLDQQERCVFTGTGDSFAAALMAELISGNRVHCVDPMSICVNPFTVKDRFLYTISISGNTKANIEAARIANKFAQKTIAITAHADSRLADICDEIIELRFRDSGILTAGSIGFTASMLSCLSFFREVRLGDIKQLFKQAQQDAGIVTVSDHMYLIGSWITYPLAMYGSAKMYEIFGIKAQYAMLEQFCHMELFSVKKTDSILILPPENEYKKSSELSATLTKNDYRVVTCKPKGKKLEEKLIYHTMLLQLIALQNANNQNLKECYFVTNNKLRGISSSLIY